MARFLSSLFLMLLTPVAVAKTWRVILTPGSCHILVDRGEVGGVAAGNGDDVVGSFGTHKEACEATKAYLLPTVVNTPALPGAAPGAVTVPAVCKQVDSCSHRRCSFEGIELKAAAPIGAANKKDDRVVSLTCGSLRAS